jgi:hypothetical protein
MADEMHAAADRLYERITNLGEPHAADVTG